ncbi:MAG: DUF2339 domain-containing protein [Planctomycetota bacterium]
MRWFAAIGALVIVAGAALAGKLAWDEGWLRLSALLRCVGLAGFGFALLGLGEMALRKWGRGAAVGLFGAGLGTVYAAVFTAFGVFELLPLTAGFALLALTALLGVAVCVRARMVSIGVLSLIGGYGAPVLAASDDPPLLALPAYLLMLTAVGVGVARWRAWAHPMRAVAWWGTTALATVWSLMQLEDHPWAVAGFAILLWALFQGETVQRLLRADLASVDDEERPEAKPSAPPTARATLRVLASFLFTAWAGLIAFGALELATPFAWAVPAMLGVACAMGTFVLAGHLSVVRDLPRTAGEVFGAGLLAQAGALLIATVAAATTGWVQGLMWVAMGLASGVAGRWLRAPALHVYALVVLSLSVVRVVLFEGAMGTWPPGSIDVGPLVFNLWSLLTAACALAWLAQAWLMTPRAPGRASGQPSGGPPDRADLGVWGGIAIVASCVGALHLLITPLPSIENGVAGIGIAIAIFWAVLGLALAGAGRLSTPLSLSPAAFGVAVLAVVPWSNTQSAQDWSASGAALLLHPGLLSALVIAGVLLAIAWLMRSDVLAGARKLGMVLAAISVVLVFAATSFEAARAGEVLLTDPSAQRGAVSIWWGVFAVGLLVAGVARRAGWLRWTGLGLLLVATGKAVVLDLAGANPLVRVASFIVLGLIMLAVALGYARASAGRRGADGSEPGAPADGSADG